MVSSHDRAVLAVSKVDTFPLLAVGWDFGRVVFLNFSPTGERSENLVSPGNDLVALFQAAQDLDVSASGDAGRDRDEVHAEFALGILAENVDALQRILASL